MCWKQKKVKKHWFIRFIHLCEKSQRLCFCTSSIFLCFFYYPASSATFHLLKQYKSALINSTTVIIHHDFFIIFVELMQLATPLWTFSFNNIMCSILTVLQLVCHLDQCLPTFLLTTKKQNCSKHKEIISIFTIFNEDCKYFFTCLNSLHPLLQFTL